MSRPSLRCDWLALWILFSAWCVVSGWVLSAFGQLDRAGYAVCAALFLVGVACKRRFWQIPAARPLFLTRRPTYRRWLPKLWLALALLAFAGGAIYHPDNYDYLSYRFPRVLHWAWDHHWYWINGTNPRQDFSAVGMEWLMTPLFIFFHTDRLFFLINFVSFLFLPGLVFSVFRRLGISGRVAWWWMWFLPTGYCFLLQAASMGNDGFAATYLLAAFYYAFRADRDSPQALVLSLLSMALLTGTKASNVPLVLPWLGVLWLRRGTLLPLVRPGLLAGACVVAAVCSVLPILVANIYFTGSYTGDPGNTLKLEVHRPLIGLAGNSLEFIAGNGAPPLWPRPLNWHMPAGLDNAIKAGFPRFELFTHPFQIEENAGIGLGLSLFAVLGIFYGIQKGCARRRPGFDLRMIVLVSTTAIACLVFMAKLGSEADPRLFAAYYVTGIMAVLLLFPLDGRVIYRQGWRGAGYAAVVLAFLLVILNPSRVLLPTHLIAAGLLKSHISAPAVKQLENNYELRRSRRDCLVVLRQSIPPGEKVVGCLGGGDDPEVSLWLPFGSRAVVDVTPTTDLAARHIRAVVVSAAALAHEYHLTLPELLKKWSMKIVQTEKVKYRTNRPEETWYLLEPV